MERFRAWIELPPELRAALELAGAEGPHTLAHLFEEGRAKADAELFASQLALRVDAPSAAADWVGPLDQGSEKTIAIAITITITIAIAIARA